MATVKVSEGWRIVIPAEVREKLDINQGDELVCEERDGELVYASKRARIRRAQETFRQMLPDLAGRSVVDELLADRRTEAAREEAETQEYASRREASNDKPRSGT